MLKNTADNIIKTQEVTNPESNQKAKINVKKLILSTIIIALIGAAVIGIIIGIDELKGVINVT